LGRIGIGIVGAGWMGHAHATGYRGSSEAGVAPGVRVAQVLDAIKGSGANGGRATIASEEAPPL
jgi:hypothetical protein